jgi:hypothetical protein
LADITVELGPPDSSVKDIERKSSINDDLFERADSQGDLNDENNNVASNRISAVSLKKPSSVRLEKPSAKSRKSVAKI